MRRALCRGPRPLCLLTCLLLALGLLPQRASAHAWLIQSSPQAGDRLPTSPRTITMQFTEAVGPAGSTHITLRNTEDHAAPLGALQRSSDGSTLVATVPPLTSGIYVMHWQVISADDGHLSAGEFAFAVGAGGALPALTSRASTPTSWPDALASWLFLLGLAVAAGGLASDMFVWNKRARDQHPTIPRAPLTPALVAALLGAGILFVLFAGSLDGGGLTAGIDPRRWSAALHLRAGFLMVLALCLLLAALATSSFIRLRGATLVLLMAVGASIGLRSHPAGTHTWWGLPAIIIHVVLALLWIGLLTHLVLVLAQQSWVAPRSVINDAVRRYARLALWSVLAVLLSGLGAAVAEFSTPSQVLTSAYGRLLLVKAALVALALVLALWARLRALGPPADLLRRLTRGEAGVVAVILGVSALLSNVAPPSVTRADSAAASALLGAPAPVGPALHLAGQAGWLQVYVSASAGSLTMHVLAPGDLAPHDVRLSLAALLPTRRESDLFPRSCGPGCFSMHVIWLPGTTRLSVQAAAPGWAAGAATIDVPWPPRPLAPRLLGQVMTAMRAQKVIAVEETVSSGPGARGRSVARLPGATLMGGEPYSGHVLDVRSLPSSAGLTELVVDLPGAHIWVHMWVDQQHRLRREVIVAPGHLIERVFSYP